MDTNIKIELNNIYNMDCIEGMRLIASNSIDSIVTDPPYELGFMNKKWDSTGIAYSIELWKEALRILKPGGHLLAFGGTRTYHRMACAIEDAGFEIRDCIQWIYSSGFPKSHNIGKKIKEMEGFGTCLKPANEPIVMARKPLSEKSVVKNVLKWGTGGINIDGCRIETFGKDREKHIKEFDRWKNENVSVAFGSGLHATRLNEYTPENGRFPANVIFDEEAGQEADEKYGDSSYGKKEGGYSYQDKEYEVEGFIGNIRPKAPSNYGDSGGISRYFYCSKVNQKERGEGNTHPTVKPINLISYLCRLVTPPNGIILDPFMGSGTTAISATKEGFFYIGFEMDEHYCEIAKNRIKEK